MLADLGSQGCLQALQSASATEADRLMRDACRALITSPIPGIHHPGIEAIAEGIRSGVPQFNLLVPWLFTVVSLQSHF